MDRVELGCRLQGRVVSLYGEFERGCLDGALGDLKRLLGFSGEVALLKRFTLCVECKGYP